MTRILTAFLILFASIASASMTLADFTAGGCITDGDKQFCGIQGSVTGSGNRSPLSLADLSVDPLSGPETGIRITGAIASLGVGSSVDIAFTYRVSVLDPSFYIVGVGLDANFAGVGTVLGNITEDIADGANNPLASMSITVPPFCPGGCSADVVLDGFQSLIIDKDILLASFADGSSIALSIIDQTFEQAGGNVPEPATAALLGTGLVLFSQRRRRRHRA